MSEILTASDRPISIRQVFAGDSLHGRSNAPARPSPLARYGVSLIFVALATAVAFGAEQVAGAPNLSLIYVLPVIAAATVFGFGPSLAATVAGVLAFDYFFTEPKFSLEIARPTDIWAAAVLLVISIIVSALAAQSRRREQAAQRAAEQASALQNLAHVVIQSGSRDEIVAGAATALSRIFLAPSVIFIHGAGALRLAARAGGAEITPAEEEAAAGALEIGVHLRAETYPFMKSAYDFWPVVAGHDGGCVLGVGPRPAGYERPKDPDQFIEIVGAYLTVAFGRPASGS